MQSGWSLPIRSEYRHGELKPVMQKDTDMKTWSYTQKITHCCAQAQVGNLRQNSEFQTCFRSPFYPSAICCTSNLLPTLEKIAWVKYFMIQPFKKNNS